METKNKKKTFDAVAYMREQRKVISERLSKMSADEIAAYFEALEKSIQNVGVRPSA